MLKKFVKSFSEFTLPQCNAQPLGHRPWNSFTFVGELCSFSAPGAPSSTGFRLSSNDWPIRNRRLKKIEIIIILDWKYAVQCWMIDFSWNSSARKWQLASAIWWSWTKYCWTIVVLYIDCDVFLCETANKAVTLLFFSSIDLSSSNYLAMVDIVPNSQEIIGHGSFSIVYKARLEAVSYNNFY